MYRSACHSISRDLANTDGSLCLQGLLTKLLQPPQLAEDAQVKTDNSQPANSFSETGRAISTCAQPFIDIPSHMRTTLPCSQPPSCPSPSHFVASCKTAHVQHPRKLVFVADSDFMPILTDTLTALSFPIVRATPPSRAPSNSACVQLHTSITSRRTLHGRRLLSLPERSRFVRNKRPPIR